jgi:hypothetical protein
MGIVFIQTCYNPKSAFDYQIHDTPTARKQNKFLYDTTERISTIENFDTDEKPDENAELFNDLMELLYNKTTWREFIQKKPKRIHMITNIRVAFETLFRETYGYSYFQIYENQQRYIKRTKQELPPPKTQVPKMEFVPLPKDTDLPW